MIGIVTDRDLGWKIWELGRDPEFTEVAIAMNREVVPVRAEDDLQLAPDVMAKHQLPGIPVVDGDQRVLGIIAQGHLSTSPD